MDERTSQNSANAEYRSYMQTLEDSSFKVLLQQFCSDEFKNNLDSLLEFDNFIAKKTKEKQGILEELRSNFNCIKDDDDFLKYKRVRINEIRSGIKLFFQYVKKLDLVKKYKTDGSNNINVYQQTATSLDQNIASAIDQLYQFIHDIKEHRRSEEFKNIAKEYQESSEKNLVEFEKKVADFKNSLAEMEKIKEDAKKIEGNIKTNLSEKAVRESSGFFAKQATLYAWRVSFSILAIIFLLLIITYLAKSFLNNDPCSLYKDQCVSQIFYQNNIFTEKQNNVFTEKSLVKFFLFSVLLSTLYQVFKSYNAYSHQYVVNKHRHLCLQTYLTDFADSGYSNEAKDRILMKTADAIFDVGDTGFIKVNQDKEKGNYQLTLSPKLNASDSK